MFRMNTVTNFLLLLICCMVLLSAMAASPVLGATDAYDTNPGPPMSIPYDSGAQGPNPGSYLSFDYSYRNASRTLVSDVYWWDNGGVGGSGNLSSDFNGLGTGRELDITKNGGGTFAFKGLTLCNFTNNNGSGNNVSQAVAVYLRGYSGGVKIYESDAVYLPECGWGATPWITYTPATGWGGIDELRIVTTDMGKVLDPQWDNLQYSLASLPTVTGISPSSGPTGGGTSVTITGANLSSATSVKFGSASASITSNTDTRIVATSPAGSAGTVDITVTTDGGTSATSSSDQFTYIVPPTVDTQAATGVTATGATLNGTVNANGSSTTVTFDYGLTIGYGSTVTASQSPVTGAVNANVSAPVTGLSCETTYHFRVKGVNYGGTTNGGDATFTTSACNTAPTFVGGSTTSTVNQNASASDIKGLLHVSDPDIGQTLTWSQNAAPNHGGALSFSSSTASSGGADITPGGTITYQPATGYAGTETFTIQVSDGTATATRAITVSVVPPASTATAATSITTAGFNANWGSVTGATGYYLDVATDSGFTSFVSGYDNKNVGSVTSDSVTGLSAGSTYYYRVRAYAGSVTGSDSNTITALTLPGSSTAGAATSNTTIGFNANWGSVTGAAGYYLDVATDSGFTGFVSGYNNKNVGSVTTDQVTGLSAGTTYYYRVRAYNASGAGANSNTITATTIPAAPMATAPTSVTTTSFSVNWDSVTGAAGYYLDIATDSGFTSFVSGYNNLNVGDVNTYAVTGLSAAATYYYRVRAYNDNGTGADSNTITVPPRHTVTPSSGGHGGISPDSPLLLFHNAVATFTLSPDTGYHIDTVGGTCGGTLSGNTYTTLPVTGSCTIEAVFAPATQWTVSVAVSGSGSGSVYSDPAGVICPLGNCSAQFSDATAATLTAVPDADSTFGGWSGACTNASGPCELSITSNSNVTAAFSASPKIRIGDTGYDTFSEAYAASTSGAVIKARSVTFMESLILNGNKQVLLEGGYNAAYDCNSCGDNTSINGSLTVESGQVIIENLTIK